MAERFVSEAITPDAGTFTPEAMAGGEPSLPTRWRWRGRDFEVAEELERWKDLTPTSFEAERYLRRHWFRVRTVCGATAVLYFQRRSRDVRGGKRWFLYTLDERDR